MEINGIQWSCIDFYGFSQQSSDICCLEMQTTVHLKSNSVPCSQILKRAPFKEAREHLNAADPVDEMPLKINRLGALAVQPVNFKNMEHTQLYSFPWMPLYIIDRSTIAVDAVLMVKKTRNNRQVGWTGWMSKSLAVWESMFRRTYLWM